VTVSPVLRGAALAAAGALALGGCGGGAPLRGYLGALAARDWAGACRRMTPGAQRDLADAAGRSCPRALASGAAPDPAELESARREVAGADVRIRGQDAAVGPLGTAQQALKLRRVGGRWLVTS
jgi:hypothetical protein